MKAPAIIPIDRRDPSRFVPRIVGHLKRAAVVVLPTETQYALAVDAFNIAAVQSVLRLKGRDAGNPLSIFVSGWDALKPLDILTNDRERLLAEAFWPGPLTLVLKTGNRRLLALGGEGSVGIRVSPEPVVRSCLRTLGRPLIATSANPAGRQPPAAAQNQWLQRLAASGSVVWVRPRYYRRGTPSTVVDCRDGHLRVLRHGAIAESQLRRVL
ncbi:MAG TPA: L-threonylcarbamoyladenylate synthase [candidate division Zixibacteria bacterium]|jgi:L-threonylcarbamoyladenylate synthase